MLRRILVLLLAPATIGAASAHAEDAPPIGPAEKLLFVDGHLAGIAPPTSLVYSFSESTPKDPAKPRPVTLSLAAGEGGACCDVALDPSAGDLFGPIPPVAGAKANPVILYFLERDVRVMQQATGGQSAYFRRRIRLALADHAMVTDTKVRYGGRDYAAHDVKVAPYADDPRRAQLGALADKTYEFILADGIPGAVYQLRTEVTGSAAKETVLTLAEPASKGSTP